MQHSHLGAATTGSRPHPFARCLIRTLGTTSALGLVLTMLTGCGPTITAPDVVGMRLDAAHRAFEALGVENFEDTDIIGGEDAIFLDANWVVVEQSPPAGTAGVDTDTTIELGVGNEDDPEVLDVIPADSPFAIEINGDPAEADPETTQPPETTPSPTQATTQPPPSASPSQALPPAAACVRREGNPGEIYVWNSYGTDQPPDALRLGAGYVWDFGEEECITSEEFALRGNPSLPGYCTEVAKVAANPYYRLNQRPAPRLRNVTGTAGDC